MSIPWIRDQIIFWFNSEFFAIGTSSFVGASIRIAFLNYFSKTTIHSPSDGYGPLLQFLVVQSYLVPNFVGCFIMAGCIVNMKRLSAISVPFYKFLTTGMCGCITSYSSWINDGIDKEFGTTTWFRYLIMIVIEFWMTWSAFTMGYAYVKSTEESPILRNLWMLLSSGKIDKENTMLAQSLGSASPSTGGTSTTTSTDDATRANTLANALASSNAVTVTSPMTTNIRGSGGTGGKRSTLTMSKGKHDMQKSLLDLIEDDEESQGRPSRQTGRLTGSIFRRSELGLTVSEDVREADDDDEPAVLNAISGRISVWRENGIKRAETQSLITVTPQISEARSADTAVPEIQTSFAMKCLLFFQKNEFIIWFVLFWVIALPIWITVALLPNIHYYTEDSMRKNTIRSIALAPLGAWTRWGLTRFPKFKALWPEMNPQTLTANMLAVILMCCLNIYSSGPWVIAINDGKCFAL